MEDSSRMTRAVNPRIGTYNACEPGFDGQTDVARVNVPVSRSWKPRAVELVSTCVSKSFRVPLWVSGLVVVYSIVISILCFHQRSESVLHGTAHERFGSQGRLVSTRNGERAASNDYINPGDASFGLRAWWISDIHLDPFYDPNLVPDPLTRECRNKRLEDQDCESLKGPVPNNISVTPEDSASDDQGNTVPNRSFPYGRVGCDPPIQLVKSQLEFMKSIDPNPEFILITGDLAAHAFSCERHVETAFHMLAGLINTTFPQVRIVSTIGNTDLYPDSKLNGPGDPQLTHIYARYRRYNWTTDENEFTFLKGGYFKRVINSNLTILSFNSNFMIRERVRSTMLIENDVLPIPCKEREVDPANMFGWLVTQLTKARAANTSVLLVSHAAPGGKEGEDDWCPQYVRRLSNISESFSDVIVAQLYGDYNRDEIRLMWGSDGSMPVGTMVINPGTTPRRPTAAGMNPMFKQIVLQPSDDDRGEDASKPKLTIQNIHTWIFPLQYANWASASGVKPSIKSSESRGVSVSEMEMIQNAQPRLADHEWYWTEIASFQELFGRSASHDDDPIYGQRKQARKSSPSTLWDVGLTTNTVYEIYQRLLSDSSLLLKYMSYQWSGFVSNKEFTASLCEIKYLYDPDRQKCYADPAAQLL